jgi:hypothetical protein
MEEKKEVSLEDLDPIFKQAYIQKDKEETEAKKSEAKGADKKPLSETSIKDLNIPVEDRYLLDLLGAYGGKKAAQMLDTGVRKMATPPAPTMPSAGFSAPPEPRRAPTQALGAFDQLFREGTGGGAPSPAQTRVMPTPVAGGPAGPVGGPASPLQQMGGSATANYGKKFGLTDIEAGRALDMTKQTGGVHDLTSQRREGLQRVQQLGGGYVENPRFGGIMTPDQGGGRGPRATYVQNPTAPGGLSQLPPSQPIPSTPMPPQAPPQPPPQPSNLAKVGQGLKTGVGAVLNAPGVSGALGGLGIAESGQEYMKRQAAGDLPGQVMAGMGVAGGGLALVPYPMAKALGAALATASPLSLYLYDKIKAMPKNSDVPEPTPEELLAAQRPAFRYARP